MAEAAVTATVEAVLGTVISLATDRARLVLGFEEELDRLSQSATMIRRFLDDADKKKHSTDVQEWLKQLEGEVFKAEYVLDELNYENLRREVKYRNQLKKKVCFFFSYFSTLGLRSKLASRIRDINTNLERINRRASVLGLVARYQINAPIPAAAAGDTSSRQTDSIVVPDVVGRDNYVSQIVETLLIPSDKVVSVIPITGMGGLGKTTLAKSVHNNPKIVGHFGKRIWVCVAEKIQITELFKLILLQLTREEVKVNDRNVIVTRIGEKLNEQRYFLVLDDVWNDEQELWNDFFTTLEGLNATKGSWCVVTTRLEPVASVVSRTLKMNDGPYFLEKLSKDECWSIVEGKVHAGEGVPEELEALKKQILRKCDGLPLAANLIGGLLLTNEKEKWQSIVQERIYGNEINQIIKVSFDYLSPASLKKCFAYCSIFPQDTELADDELIEHWIAEGFVFSNQKNKKLMEETGGEYLRILLQNSLLEKVEVPRRKKIDLQRTGTFYKMHDLVHDFAKSILIPESNSENGTRYLALNSSEEMAQAIPASLRTLFLHLESAISADLLSRFKYLHVLKLSGDCVKFLPSSIGKLLHLRLLEISSSRIRSLPESLCKLYNLQTLTMKRGRLEGFPKQMRNLVNLRHLNYYDFKAGFKMPSQIGRLTCLQTLKFFNVSQDKGCGIEELGTLKYLKGSLEIRNLGLVNGKEAAREAKLSEKPNLSRLVFEWKSGDHRSDNSDEDVLEGLQPHQNLQELEIQNFMGDKFPQWFMNLSTLVDLWINGCTRCRELPGLGQLPSLKVLRLTSLDNIHFLGDEFYGITNEEVEEGRSREGLGGSTRRRKCFPALEELYLQSMENLVEVKDQVRSTIGEAEIDVFPMLKVIDIEECPQLITLPRSFKILREVDCPNLTSIRTGYTSSLEKLKLEFCLNLRELPGDLFGLGLKHVNISACPRLISVGVNGQRSPLPRLEYLWISRCHGLTVISGEMFESCTSLQDLSVDDCPNLVSFSLNLQDTPSLKKFTLVGCPKLITDRPRPRGFASATNLRELEIGLFSDDSSIDFDWSGLISAPTLPELTLIGMPNSKSLPHQLQYLTALTSLCLESFGGLEALPDWIGELVSLEDLRLEYCEELQFLPSETAMRCLTKLNSFRARDCPLLRQRYNPQRGIYSVEGSENPRREYFHIITT